MAKKHSGRYPQNLGICFKKSNPVFEKEILFSRRTILLLRRNILLSRTQIWLSFGDNTSRIQEAQVGLGFARQEISRPPLFFRGRANKNTAGRLRGGRASDVPLGVFAEVGRRNCLREASRRSGMHQNPTLEAENPISWAGVGQIQARQGFSRASPIFRGQANFCPAQICPTSQWLLHSARILEPSPLPFHIQLSRLFHFPKY